MSVKPTVVWFRLDLRLTDNPALHAAIARGGPVVPVFIRSEEDAEDLTPGAASRWWLHQSLRDLDDALRTRGSRLILRRGGALAELREVAREVGADAIYWNRRYEPGVVERDRVVKTSLRDEGREARSFNGALIFEPWEIEKASGGPYQVFTPFYRACQARDEPGSALPAPGSLDTPKRWPASADLDELALEPAIDWADGICAAFTPGEAGARHQLRRALEAVAAGYAERRDLPGVEGTSRLSAHLHFGEISPREIWHAAQDHMSGGSGTEVVRHLEAWLRQLAWRDFAHHLLHHFPHTPTEPLREAFAAFPWQPDRHALRAWQRGRTGFPIVDAGMRELWTTGWMHNRVRMIVGSLLVKDLLLHSHEGAAWFSDTLVDADLANNTMGWQWIAGCGADAAPYFRIFNPITQSQKFDAGGAYIRRWVPEIAGLEDRWIHRPFEAPAGALADAGIELGRTYPRPIVDRSAARERALGAFATIRKSS